MENEIWTEDDPFDRRSAWIDLIMMANIKTKTIIYRGHTLSIKRGQVYTSTRKLASRWNWSRDKVFRYLKLLEELKMVTNEKIGFATLLTLENYGVFQDRATTNKTADKTSNDTTNKTTDKTLLKNSKNSKNERIYKPSANEHDYPTDEEWELMKQETDWGD